jgi:hypothetical protein
MRKMRWRNAGWLWGNRCATLPGALLVIALTAATLAPAARAAVGYEQPTSNPTRALPGQPRGIAVDPVSQDIYVAILTPDFLAKKLGEIDRFNSDLSADGVFAKENGYYAGVAPNPVTGGFYGAQVELQTPFGNFGTSKLDKFSSLGVFSSSFALPYPAAAPQIATDSTGSSIFYPNLATESVQVFDPTGVLIEEITCAGCPGGSFGQPTSVALNASDELYVADADPDRVVKLVQSGGSYAFESLVQSGRSAGAVAVDPGTGDVLVGDMPEGKDFHIVAYSPSGVQYDDFAAGIMPDSEGNFGSLAAYQMAVNGTTHKLYVAAEDRFYIFEKVTIDPPTTTIKPATGVGQIVATLNATVNANGHAVLECEFEYTDEADFLANGFTNATDLLCPENPDGSSVTPLDVELLGLAPATDYRYRVTATSNAGSVSSANQMFETLPEVAPTATTELPLAVAQTTATIRGKANPHGGSVSDCHFDFGKSSTYESNLPCVTLPGPVTTDVAQTKALSGLLPSATYHYRLVVTTNAGTAVGDDVEFTTASPPPEPDPVAPPASTPATSPTPSGPVVVPPPARCRKGFRRTRIRGKVRCVRICRKGMRGRKIDGKFKCVKGGRSRRERQRRRD